MARKPRRKYHDPIHPMAALLIVRGAVSATDADKDAALAVLGFDMQEFGRQVTAIVMASGQGEER